jgi:ribosomal protein S18 acetylase RimI-like enzyme
VVATLCRRLLHVVPAVGLSVQETNAAALALYSGIGFRTVLPYEEAELARQRPLP